MTDKRFTKRFFINGEIGITDKEAKKTPQIFFAYSNKEANKMCKTLNALNDENEQLKKQSIVLNDKIEFLETILKETDEDVFYATKKITEQMTLQNKKGDV